MGDTDRLAAAALANNRGMFSAAGMVDRDKVEILELTLHQLPADRPSRPLLLAALCSELTYAGDIHRRQGLADEAISLAHDGGDDATVVRVLNDVVYPLTVPQLLEQSLQRTAEALQRAEVLGDPVLLWWAAFYRGGTAVRAGEIAEMERCCALACSLAERLDQPYLNWGATNIRVHNALLAGDTDEAEARALEALDIGTRSGLPEAEITFGPQIGAVNVQRGVFPDDAAAWIEQARDQLPGLRDLLTAMLAWEHARAGRLEIAHGLLDEFAVTGFEPMPHPGGLNTMLVYTDVAIACDDQQAAVALYEWLVPYADQVAWTNVTPYPPVAHYLGRLATLVSRYETADHHFTRAATYAERAGAAYFAAETNLAWAEMFYRRRQPGDEHRARALLDAARSAAADGRYPDVERRATEALQRLG